jgi:hypothetical protein
MASRFTANGFNTSGLNADVATGPGSSTKYYGNTRFMDGYLNEESERNAYEIEKKNTDSWRSAYELSDLRRQATAGAGGGQAKTPNFAGELGKVAAGSAVSAAVTAGFALI